MAYIPTRAVARYTVNLGAKGRLVLPAKLRKQLGFSEGTQFILSVDADGSLRLETAEKLAEAAIGLSAGLEPKTSWTGAFIKQRRKEAKQEHE
jgi:AbrB family looped-hinge helix DNA binding protein